MSAKANKALIRQWIETGFNPGNWALVDEFFAPTYSCDNLQGTAALKQALVKMRTAFPDLQIRIADLVAEREKVVARFAYEGTHKGMLWGYAPTGKRLHWTGMAIFRIEQGKIAEEWAIWEQTFILRLDNPDEWQ